MINDKQVRTCVSPGGCNYGLSVTSLTLQNFRNYSDRKFEFTASKVVFVGDNGRGKTNVLEAISVASVGKSWREVSFNKSPLRKGDLGGFHGTGSELGKAKKTCNLIQSSFTGEAALINLETSQNDSYQVQIFPRKRVFKKNGKQIPRKKQLGEIPTLLFAPEYLEMFAAAKKSRQSFFDRFLCQLDPKYKELLSQTIRVVKQKNAIFTSARRELLSDNDIASQLRPWNEILQKNMPALWKSREIFLSEIEPLLQAELEKISGNDDEISVFLTRGGMEDEKNFLLDFSQEIYAKRCLFSPTRDDFAFFYRGQPLMNTVSRGEVRSVLLALLSAQKQYFFAKTKKMPILLLDDCFSELDDNRQAGLERLCEGTQAFFTTTHQEHFARFSGEVQKIEV